ncbi:MAG: hypothetical protein ABIO95_07640, partial [Bdellovibrionota bacterium]
MGWKEKISKEKLRIWAADTKTKVVSRANVLGPKLRAQLERVPSLLSLLARLPKYQLALLCVGTLLLA